MAFCPCLGTPLRIAFEDATVAPPGDLFLRRPRLQVFGVSVLWLPYFWLRSPGRFGVVPPDVAYRGQDGLFLGGGIHLPWTKDDVSNGLDLRAGGYLVGGVAIDGRLRTEVSSTRIKWDHLRGDGLAVDARGAVVGEGERPKTLAWDADTLRGARGIRSTTELDAAARVFDRTTAEASWRAGGWTLATGVRAVAIRGGGVLDFGAAGPTVNARYSEAIGSHGAYDVTLEGGSSRGDGIVAGTANMLVFARADAGALVAARLGAVGGSIRVRGAGDIANGAFVAPPPGQTPAEGEHLGIDGVAAAQAELALPLVKTYRAAEATDPLRHRIEPRLSASVLAAREEGALGPLPSRGVAATMVSGTVWTAQTTLYNAIGRWGARDGSELGMSIGAVGDTHGSARPVTRWRAATSAGWVGGSAEGAHVFAGGGPTGIAGVARYRVGRVDGVNVGAAVAFRQGVDPVIARALTEAPVEPRSGFFSRDGWTGGARLAVPWSRAITTSVGADGDLTSRELVAARASIELRDRCDCLVVRGVGAHRIGRDGVDLWVTVDLSPR